jgi:hypothetical protein
MGKYGEIQSEFMAERDRLLNALDQPENDKLVLRLVGALAFRTHCPQYGYLQDTLGRVFTDIDFASYNKCFKDIIRFLTDCGYEEDKMVTRLFGEGRLLFHDPANERHVDVFLDKLDFSHVLPFNGRLEVEDHTLPLAELVIEKMQIYRINEKDLIDTIMLLREHPVGDGDDETINAKVICKLLGDDWGLWRTVTGNLWMLNDFVDNYPQLTKDDIFVIRGRIGELQQRIQDAPKSMRWQVRAAIGEKVKWYKDVEELVR